MGIGKGNSIWWCMDCKVEHMGSCPKKSRVRSNRYSSRGDKQTYMSKEWDRCIKIVDKRDKKLCRRCLIKYHRVRPMDEHHHIKNVLDYPEERYNVSNIESLCSECHRTLHKERNGQLDYIR